jgi:crossover junction endodeoxyribonuclease RuvC
VIYILGIDPGNQGALALIREDRQLVTVEDMPIVPLEKRRQVSAALAWGLVARIAGHALGPIHCVIEKVGAMPKDGAVSAFAFGRGVGVLEGILAAREIPLERVAPNRWKARMGLTGQNKSASRAKVIERYPQHASLFARKKDDGRAEAVLLALWGLEQRTQGRPQPETPSWV